MRNNKGRVYTRPDPATSIDVFPGTTKFAGMKMILLPLLVSLGLLTACESVPANRAVTMQSINTTDLRRASYDNFVAQRTQELQQMGGPLKKNGAARLKALDEANARFVPAAPDRDGHVVPRKKSPWVASANDSRT